MSISNDGATKWSKLSFDEGLPEPICMGSILRLADARNDKSKSRIIFANPNNAVSRERKNLSVRLSLDDAKTWPVVKTIESGKSGYCDLAVLPDGTILCLYERGSLDNNDFRTRWLTLARFNLDWVTKE